MGDSRVRGYDTVSNLVHREHCRGCTTVRGFYPTVVFTVLGVSNLVYRGHCRGIL
jgi:hypothetical protein